MGAALCHKALSCVMEVSCGGMRKWPERQFPGECQTGRFGPVVINIRKGRRIREAQSQGKTLAQMLVARGENCLIDLGRWVGLRTKRTIRWSWSAAEMSRKRKFTARHTRPSNILLTDVELDDAFSCFSDQKRIPNRPPSGSSVKRAGITYSYGLNPSILSSSSSGLIFSRSSEFIATMY